jgi:hypothetical protein
MAKRFMTLAPGHRYFCLGEGGHLGAHLNVVVTEKVPVQQSCTQPEICQK